MKTEIHNLLIAVGVLIVLNTSFSNLQAQGTAFTYQGRLNSGANPVNGSYDMKFTLYPDPGLPAGGGPPIAGPVIINPVAVSNGLFTVNIDFGPGIFQGQPGWLEFGVRKQGDTSPYQTLSPRQSVTPTPYALYAPSAGVANNVLVTATVQGQSLNIGLGNLVSGSYGSVGGGNNNTASGGLSVVAGGAGNVSSGMFGAVGGGSNNVANGNISAVAGGEGNQAIGDHAFVGGGFRNFAMGPYNTVGGGINNVADPSFSTVSGGSGNSAINFGAVVGGGGTNIASGLDATVAGGSSNLASGNFSSVGGGLINGATNDYATVSGGSYNTASAYGAVGGGFRNVASGNWATVPGGSLNTASGANSLAAGSYANAMHRGSFVWGDSQPYNFSSSGNDQFCIRAQGGVQLDPKTSLFFGFSTRQMLNLYDVAYGIGVQNYTLYQRTAATGGFAWYAGGIHSNAQNDPGSAGTTLMTLDNGGKLTVNCLTLLGGCDVAEPFEMSSAEIPKGAVVVIDKANPGQLKRSLEPYDTRVAGVVSGANGINPGLQLKQLGALESGINVALSGRVYVQADASYGAIEPGDLLTTSSTPGHAMRVSDHTRAQGAILGKAMTGLKEGQGMVLVLVSLQ